MKNFTEIIGELKRESINSPIIHQCFEMQRVNDLQTNYTLAAMALSLAKALKESQEKHLDAEMRAWPRAIVSE